MVSGQWEEAKAQATEVLIDVAKGRGRIAYSEPTPRIDAIDFEAEDPRFWHMLGEISQEEDAAGRGMLSAIVVHKSGDMIAGKGFYELAKKMGKKVSEVDRFWLQQFNRVHDYWANTHSN